MVNDNKKQLTILTCMALLIALNIILTRFLSINTQFLRISLGMIPVALAGGIFGPVWGGICGAVGDVLGMLIFPSGPYFPGFTVTAALTGIIYGLFLYHKENSSLIRNTLIASLIVCIGCNLLLDTLWLNMLYGSGFLAILPARVIKCLLNIPIYSFLILFLWNKAIIRIPFLHNFYSKY